MQQPEDNIVKKNKKKQESYHLNAEFVQCVDMLSVCRHHKHKIQLKERDVNMQPSESWDQDICEYMCDSPVDVRSLNCSSFIRVALVSSSSCRSSGGLKNSDMLFTVIYTKRSKTLNRLLTLLYEGLNTS